MDIGNGSWQHRRRDTQGVRKLHHFNRHLVAPILRPVIQPQQSIYSRHRFQQRQQLRLCQDGDVTHATLHQWSEADELNRISQTVVAAYQDALTRQRSAVPNPLQMSWQPSPGRVAWLSAKARAADTIADAPGAFPVAATHVRQPLVRMLNSSFVAHRGKSYNGVHSLQC